MTGTTARTLMRRESDGLPVIVSTTRYWDSDSILETAVFDYSLMRYGDVLECLITNEGPVTDKEFYKWHIFRVMKMQDRGYKILDPIFDEKNFS
jgi:hypothetical protein